MPRTEVHYRQSCISSEYSSDADASSLHCRKDQDSSDGKLFALQLAKGLQFFLGSFMRYPEIKLTPLFLKI